MNKNEDWLLIELEAIERAMDNALTVIEYERLREHFNELNQALRVIRSNNAKRLPKRKM